MFNSSVVSTKNFLRRIHHIQRSSFFSIQKMTNRSQKRKAVAELVSGEFESSVAENNSSENLVRGPSKTLRVEPENLDEIKTSLRKETMSDLTMILSENQKEMPKLIAPLSTPQNSLYVWTIKTLVLSQKTSPLPERLHL